ncbi:methyltransferase C-terminal domain-containing protein [Siccirubricoccus deserti]|uniref:methyltransferase C-terminal domain-containing protein n=1 Tax=Siccirubricoccus deserti TaxID=2013562 RepID=UPI0021BD644C|nr:methyltransferase C-terminal domain-containing protein [Siccirubricoccus deserti]
MPGHAHATAATLGRCIRDPGGGHRRVADRPWPARGAAAGWRKWRPGAGPGAAIRACRACGALIHAGLVDLGLMPVTVAPVSPTAAAEPVAAVGLELLLCPDCRLLQPAHRVTVPAEPRLATERCVTTLIARFQLRPDMPVTVLADGGAGWLPMLRRFGFTPGLARSGTAVAQRLREVTAPPGLLLAGDAIGRSAALPDLLEGIRQLLAPGGIAVFDLPDLLRVVEANRFDLFCPGRNAWPSLLVAEMLLGQHGLVVCGLVRPPGLLRLLVCHAEDHGKPVGSEVAARRAAERVAGLESGEAYQRLAEVVLETRAAVFDLLLAARRDDRQVLGLGASAAAARLLAGCGIGPGLLPGTVDAHPPWHGMVLPGSRVPVVPPEALAAVVPDLVLVLDGRPASEARQLLGEAGLWTARIAVILPKFQIIRAGTA